LNEGRPGALGVSLSIALPDTSADTRIFSQRFERSWLVLAAPVEGV
jgi:hypothetical protein